MLAGLRFGRTVAKECIPSDLDLFFLCKAGCSRLKLLFGCLRALACQRHLQSSRKVLNHIETKANCTFPRTSKWLLQDWVPHQAQNHLLSRTMPPTSCPPVFGLTKHRRVLDFFDCVLLDFLETNLLAKGRKPKWVKGLAGCVGTCQPPAN